MGVVLQDMAQFIDAAALVTGPAAVFKVAKLVAVSAQVKGLTGLSVMAALAAPSTCVHLDVGAISLGVIEGGAANMDFISCHEIGRGVLEDYLWGEAVEGVGVGEGCCTVVVVFLELEELLAFIHNAVGGIVDAGIEGTVAYYFHMERVIAFEVDGVINQL